MTALTHDNISLTFDSGIAFMTLSGPVGKDDVDKTLDWLSQTSEANDEFDLCVDMAKMGFPSLGAVDKAFKDVGHVLRMNPSINKCAILTDSPFIQSKAKVEGAVIPGTKIESFDIEELAPAVKWLNDGEHVELSPEIMQSQSAETKEPETVDLKSMFGL